MKYYTIYKVTNKTNGKIYIGSHKTTNLNDGYMGSGKYLRYSQEKHGIENFEKEILHVFDTPELMYAKEAELVNEEFIAEANTYNLKVGGFGGWDYINSTGKNLYGKNGKTPNVRDNLARGRKTVAEKKESDPEYNKRIREKQSNANKGRLNAFKGKQHTEQTKKFIGENSAKHQKGQGNSQHGKVWIYSVSEQKSRKIYKNDSLPEGWQYGRKIKF